MTENPYAPTETRLEDSLEAIPAFYIVSPHKFAALFVLTAGLYAIYWFYENWRRYRLVSGESLWPVVRAIFPIFFVHSLFVRVQQRLVLTGIEVQWNAGAYATWLVILILIDVIVDRLIAVNIGRPVTDLLSILTIIPYYILLARVQGLINLACGDEHGTENDHLTVANYLWMAIGLVIWLMVVIGMLSIVFNL